MWPAISIEISVKGEMYHWGPLKDIYQEGSYDFASLKVLLISML
jgi:hypothetical protein